jgi:hypothetical protein
MGFPLSVICCGRPIELDKPHILALAAETGFLLLREQVPLKFKKEISAVQCERKTFRLISLSTLVSFRWIVPLSIAVLERPEFNRLNKQCRFSNRWYYISSYKLSSTIKYLCQFVGSVIFIALREFTLSMCL